MNQQTDKAILVVSFGTSYEASRKATIEKIEQDIADAFGDHRIYRAWTSKMIISVLKKRDNYIVPTVKEAMEVLIALGYKQSEVDKVVKKLTDENLDTNGYVKKALSLIVK